MPFSDFCYIIPLEIDNGQNRECRKMKAHSSEEISFCGRMLTNGDDDTGLKTIVKAEDDIE